MLNAGGGFQWSCCQLTVISKVHPRKKHAISSTIMIDLESKQVGHGLLLWLGTWETYVLTSAHLAVMFVREETLSLKMHPWNESSSCSLEIDDVYLTKAYTMDGVSDIGLIWITTSLEFKACDGALS